jgi:hypothetical protein
MWFRLPVWYVPFNELEPYLAVPSDELGRVCLELMLHKYGQSLVAKAWADLLVVPDSLS